MKAVSVEDLSFSYGKDLVLENVSLDVEHGDFIGVVGPNGSGKTTLMKNILGLLTPSKGSVQVYGKNPKKAHKQGLVGYVPQHYKRDEHFPATVKELLGSSYNSNSSQNLSELFDEFGVKGLENKKFESLSGGQQQKVVTTMALSNDPKLLILDEPSVGVDVGSQKVFYDYLKKINDEQGITVMVISHDIGAISKHTRKAVYLNKSVCCRSKTSDLPKVLEETYGEDFRHYSHAGHSDKHGGK